MNNMKIPIEITVVLSSAIASVAIGMLAQQQHRSYAFNNQQFQSRFRLRINSYDDINYASLIFNY